MSINTIEAKQIIKHMLRRAYEGKSVMALHFRGGPGIGKSALAEQAVAEFATEIQQKAGYYVHFLANREATDVKGIPMPAKDPTGALIVQYSRPSWALPHDAPPYGMVHFDEFGQCDYDVQKPTAEILNARRLEHYALPRGYIVGASSNREKDRAGVKKILTHIQNRFIELEVKAELQPWLDWAIGNNVNEIARSFAEFRPAKVFHDEVPSDPGPFCTPRSLTRLADHIGEVPDSLFMQMAMGAIGEGTAAELMAYMRVYAGLPKYEEIVANPKTARLPAIDRADAMHACMSMLVERVGKLDADKVFDYMSRMPEEFQIAGLKKAFKRTPSIVQCRGFGDWLRKNSKLVMAANITAA